MNETKIVLNFDLEQVCNDVLTKCNLISVGLKDEALEDIRANIQEPDNPETRSIINRAITEAFGDVKSFCQRYLKTGRTVDNNMLERIIRDVVYTRDSGGHATDTVDHYVYETITLELFIPNFNVSVTDALKSAIHGFVRDYTMASFLDDQLPDKAAEYHVKTAEGHKMITKLLNSREKFTARKPSWI
ncbi:MAG: hypothetical protein IJQ13_04655 [Prevotella sp.]|nr:hypothetical protein [Prevotella sp.]